MCLPKTRLDRSDRGLNAFGWFEHSEGGIRYDTRLLSRTILGSQALYKVALACMIINSSSYAESKPTQDG